MSTKSERVSRPEYPKLIVEKDVKIPLRDGTLIYADIFRPDGGDARFPALMNIGPYQKDMPWIPPAGIDEKPNEYLAWETVNPVWWCARGYACVRVDSRGTGKSPGRADLSSYQEAVDFYDAIEWVARRPWCSGNIGTSGTSYHANCQWRVASLQPPSLKAIIPWEGRADIYRDQVYHGGIFSFGQVTNWINTQTAHHLLGRPRSYNPDAFQPDMLWQWMRNDLDSDFWRMRSARWDRITVPVYSCGNWGGHQLHLRGNIEAFMNAASRHKKLRVHTGSHRDSFYSEEGKLDQLRWLDYWLKGIDTGIMDEPPVKLEIRTGGSTGRYPFRFENEWPLARTRWTRMYLKIERETSADPNAVAGRLAPAPPQELGKLAYPASESTHAGVAPGSPQSLSHGIGRRGVSFETVPMAEDTEVTGPLVLNLWVSSTSEDMDIFVTIRNIGPDGKDICEVGQQSQQVPAVTKGWLRASHRKLDPQRSLPYRPYHAHDERWWLKPDEIVECQVEIWPTSMVFSKGHKLRLDIQPRDGVGTGHYTHYHADYNIGAMNTIYAGGDKPSYLLLPVIPSK